MKKNRIAIIKRIVAVLLAVMMILSATDIGYAENESTLDITENLCPHHTEHTEECGFDAENGIPCNYHCDICEKESQSSSEDQDTNINQEQKVQEETEQEQIQAGRDDAENKEKEENNSVTDQGNASDIEEEKEETEEQAIYQLSVQEYDWEANYGLVSKNQVLLSMVNEKNLTDVNTIIKLLNNRAGILTLSYSYNIRSEDGTEQTVTRTKENLEGISWSQENMDFSQVIKAIEEKNFYGASAVVRIKSPYLKTLILKNEKEKYQADVQDDEIDFSTEPIVELKFVFGQGDYGKNKIQNKEQYMIDTVNPSNVSLNIFDYWITDPLITDSYADGKKEGLISSGVNKGHALLFHKVNTGETWNNWTGTSGGVTAGIVSRKIAESGYPQLDLASRFNATGKWTIDNKQYTYDPTEDLSYLFDVDEVKNSDYGESYSDVKGLFKINEQGNYYYCSHENFAEFDEEKNAFNVYNTWGVQASGTSPNGQFFLFNSADQVFKEQNGSITQSGIASLNNLCNHYFGLSMEAEFQQPIDGMVSVGSKAKPMTFDFSGDDDVWIFIDGVLVADLGGVHDEMSVSIDFSTGNVDIQRAANPNANTTIHTTIKDEFVKAGMEETASFDGNTFAGNTKHTLQMFYLERGNTDSNLTLSFNLLEPKDSTLVKVDQNGDPVQNAEFGLYVAQTDNDGKPIQNSDGTYQLGEEIGSSSEIVTGEDGYCILPEYDFSKYTYYVLREKGVPDGYFSPGDILLRYDKYEKHMDGTASGTNMLLVENRWTTGAVSNFSATIYQAGALKYEENGKEISREKGERGLLLAVPLMKDTDGKWQPVYGSNMQGYHAIDYDADNGNVEENQRMAILEAFLYQIYGAEYLNSSNDKNGYQEWYLEWSQDEMRYHGILEDLPGDATRYYWASGNESADMTVSYYFLDLENLQNVFGDLTVQDTEGKLQKIAEELQSGLTGKEDIDSEELSKGIEQLAEQIVKDSSEQTFGLLNVESFNRLFSSRIYIPDVQPELRVKKLDQDGNPLQGVRFGLFDTRENAEKETNPVAYGTTNQDGILLFANETSGTAKIKFQEGNYYLKEMQTLDGYEGTDAVIPVVVTKNGRVYADALEENDGITVQKGLGKLLQTMVRYASEGSVNVTLRDISATLMTGETISGISGIDEMTEADPKQTLHLHYGLTNALLEYGTHEINGVAPNPYFEVDKGFAGIKVEQNYDAHEGEILYSSLATKTNLEDTNIRGLFTGSTTVVVRNRTGETGKFSVKKTVSGKNGDETKRFTFDISVKSMDQAKLDVDKDYPFTITKIDEESGQEVKQASGTLKFADKDGSYKISDITVSSEAQEEPYFKKEDGCYKVYLKHNEIITVDGMTFGLQVTVKETDRDGYQTYVNVNNGTWNESDEASGIVTRPVGNPFFHFNNNKDALTNMSLEKIVEEGEGEQDRKFPFQILLRDANGAETLTGTYQYQIWRKGNTGDPENGEIRNGTLDTELASGDRIEISSLPVGATYLITEFPMGYAPSVTVDGENVSVVNGKISGTLKEAAEGSNKVNAVVYTNSRSGSITITKRNGTGQLLSGAGFTLYKIVEGKKVEIEKDKKTELAMLVEIDVSDPNLDLEAMRYKDEDKEYIVHMSEEEGTAKYFYYRFLTENEKNKYYQGKLEGSEKVEAIVQFTELELQQEYAIEETIIPEGYAQNGDFEEKFGSITLPLDKNGKDYYDLLYTVTNHQKMVLPTAGLFGIGAVIGIGCACILISVFLWRMRKKKYIS